MKNEYDFEEEIRTLSVNGNLFRCHVLDEKNFAKNENVAEMHEEQNSSNHDIQHDGKQFVLKMEIDPSMYGMIIGKKGKTLHNIQGRTGAVIVVPGKNEKSNVVIVKSSTKQNVVRAADQIEIILADGLERSPYTHFLSLPLISEEVCMNVKKLEDKIADDEVIPRAKKRGFDPSICVKPQHFHLTLFMLQLVRKQDLNRLKLLLKENTLNINERVLGNGHIVVNLEGFEIMNDDPSDTHVLFAKIGTEDDRLGKLIRFLGDLLLREGFIKEEDLDVKLHATVLNSRYRGGGGEETAKRVSFDATEILKLKCSLGTKIKIPTMELSKRGSYDKRGYYQPEHIIQLV